MPATGIKPWVMGVHASVEPETGVSQCAILSDYQARHASKHVKWPGSQVCMSPRVGPLEELSTRGSRPNNVKNIPSQTHLRDLFPCACECQSRRQLGRARIHSQPQDRPSSQAQLLVGSAWDVFPAKGPSSRSASE